MENKKQKKINGIPYIAIGNNELANKKKAGKFAICPNCKKKKKIEYGKSKKLLPNGKYTKLKTSKMLGFVNCGDKSYMVTLSGKLI